MQFRARACLLAAAIEHDVFFAFHKWRHFADVVDRFRYFYVEFLQDSLYQKLYISVYFDRVIQKIKSGNFWGHSVH